MLCWSWPVSIQVCPSVRKRKVQHSPSRFIICFFKWFEWQWKSSSVLCLVQGWGDNGIGAWQAYQAAWVLLRMLPLLWKESLVLSLPMILLYVPVYYMLDLDIFREASERGWSGLPYINCYPSNTVPDKWMKTKEKWSFKIFVMPQRAGMSVLCSL